MDIPATVTMGRISSGWQLSTALLELLGLMMWIGGLTIILTAVIPAVFNTMGMETGGRFLRRVFDSYNTLTSGIVIVLLVTTFVRWWKSGVGSLTTSGITSWEVGLLLTITFVTGCIVFMFEPHVIALQEQAFAAQGELPKKVAYEAFFRIHMIVRALHLLNAALVISLLVVKFKHWVSIQGTCDDAS